MTADIIKITVVRDDIPPVIKIDNISYKVKD